MFPIEIKFRDIEQSPFIYNDIMEHAEKLMKFNHDIMSCNVTVSAPHRHHYKGVIYHIQVRVHLPGYDIVVNREPEKNGAHEDVYVAIRDAFNSVRRRLESRFHNKHKEKMHAV